MKTIPTYILSIISLLFLSQLTASGQVNVSIQVLPPYPTKFTDYASKPQQVLITVTNTSTVTQRIQLRGSVTGDNGISIRSKMSYKSTSAIELGAGQARNLNGNDIAYFFDYTNLQYSGITQSQFISMGGLPEGSYQFCLRAYNYDTNAPLSAEEPSGCSNTFSISSLEPPTILSPMNEQTVQSGPGQIFSIRWSTPVGTPPGVQYRIRMVEILGNRNPNDAIMTATQPYFFEREVMTNMYVYNPADPQLTPGRNYALLIEAFDPFNSVAFRNKGRSEVIMFTFGEPLLATRPAQEVIKIKDDTLSVRTTIVKGNLKYRFPESPESGLFALNNTKVFLEKVYVTEVIGADGIHSWKPVSNALAARTPFLTNPTDSVFATTDKNGNFEIRLAMTALDSSGVLTDYHKSLLTNKTSTYTTKTTTFNQQARTNDMAIMYQLKFSNPHFKSDPTYLRIVPGDTINLQQRTIESNSYQLNLNVSESFNGLKGKFVAGAKVRIYRLKADKTNKNLAIPLYEGNLLDSAANWKEFGNKVLIAEATTPTPDSLQINNQSNAQPFTVAIKRLFRNIALDGDHYLVTLEKGEQVLARKSFDQLIAYKSRRQSASLPTAKDDINDIVKDFAYNQPADTAYLTLQKELTVSPRSKVTGTLKYAFKYYAGVPSQPYANMKVTLRSSQNMKNVIATATTDAQGKFSFDFENVDSIKMDQFNIAGRGLVTTPSSVYYVVPEVKYYAIPNNKIVVQPWATQDVGELISMVRTYTLKIDAQGENYKPASKGKVGINGVKLPDVEATLDPMGQAEILVLRYSPETYKNQIPNLVGMNTDQKISFGNTDGSSNNYSAVSSSSASSIYKPAIVMGETNNRSNEFVLQRKVYTEANGSTVVIKGLIPSIDLNNDRYQIRIGSGDRTSNNVAYETTMFHFPELRVFAVNIPVYEQERQNMGQLIQQEKDKLYDPTWGQAGQVQLDPGGSLIRNGITASQLVGAQNANQGLGLNKTITKGIGAGKVGFSFIDINHNTAKKEWQDLGRGLKGQRLPTPKVATKKEGANVQYTIAGPVISDTAMVFNDQLPAQETQYDEMQTVVKKEWRIAGRAIDATSKLGIKNVQIALLQKIGNSNTEQTYGSTSANSNGDFILTESTMAQYGSTSWNPQKEVSLGIYADGYKPKIVNMGRMVKGQQFYDEQLMLEPLGKGMYGYVHDASNKGIGVPARIKMLDNGAWVNSVPYTGKKHLDNMNYPQDQNETVSDAQRFAIDLPTTTVKLVIMPYDRGYLTDTVSVTVIKGKYYLRDFPLVRRKHKMNIFVGKESDRFVKSVVTIVETGLQDTINMDNKPQTFAYFAFENNATKNFTVHVQPLSNESVPGKNMFAPQTFTISNEDDGQTKSYNLNVAKGRLIKGKVTFENGSPAAGAKIYLETGSGSATDNFSKSSQDGEYKLVLPQISTNQYTVRANYFQEGKTFVSAEKIISGSDTAVNLVIREIKEIDISRLLGFKTKVNTITATGNGAYIISGELYDVPANGNFKTTDSILNRNLVFNGLKIKASALKNTAGVPMAIPVDDRIITDNKEIAVKINNAFNGIILGETDRIVINKTTSDTVGTIVGKVRILDNSFEFPSSYMRMESTDFYLGVNRAAEAFAVFSSNNKNAIADRFLLTNRQGSAISFRYLGFKGIADIQGNRSSNLKGETIQLFMNLSTVLPGNIPLTLKAGEAQIKKGGIGKIITSDSLSFGLENWMVKAGSATTTLTNGRITKTLAPAAPTWELSPTSGGLVLKKGEIITGKLNVPFTNMTIIPSEENLGGDLVCESLTDENSLKNLNFNIGGIAKLKLRAGAKSMFIYDPGVGRDGHGHYKLSITGANFNDYPASFSGLDGMTNPRDEFKIQIISLLSNGEELFGFANDQAITYYNQIKFLPKTLSTTSQNSLSIAGSIDLGIPGLNTKFYETLLYIKEGTRNKVTMPVLDFSFLGQGNTKFTALAKKEAQQYKPEGFVIAGNLALPGGVNLNGAKLISVVSNGAQKLLDATGVAGIIPPGVTQEVERQVDVVFGAREQIAAYFDDAKDQINQAKDQLKAEIQQVKDELLAKAETAVKDQVTKLIPMGTDELKGALGDLAGAWKLGNTTFKQGQDVIAAVKDGDYMKIAGMMKNIPGVNDAIKDIKNKVTMEAKNVLTAAQEKLPDFKDVPISGDGFEPGKFEFDLKNGKVFGSITFKIITLGAVTLRDGGMEMLFDRGGWYFCSGATMDIPVPLITPLKVGLLIGNYGQISDEVEARVTHLAQSVSTHLPPRVKSGLSGFFVVGGKPIADVDMGFGVPGIAQFKLVASAGAEVRTYALFGRGSATIGMGALVYGRVFASASGMGVSVSGGAEVNVAVASTATFANGNFGLCVQGCASIDFNVEACVFGQCGSIGAGISALLNLGIGDRTILGGSKCLEPGVNLKISTSGGSCVNNPSFEF